MLNLYHLKYFLDAARKLSITESAKINHVSVSAISQAIRMLESQLGTSLLKHRKKDFCLTPAGRAMMAEAIELLDHMIRLKKNVLDSKKVISGTIRIACSNAVAQVLLPKILKDLQSVSAEIRPVVFLANARRTRELILNREIDIALAVHEAPLSIFESTPIVNGNFIFVKAADGNLNSNNTNHADSSKNKNSIKAKRGSSGKTKAVQIPFENQLFITGDVGEEIDQFKMQFARKFAQQPKISVELQSWMASLSLARCGVGVALIPDFLIKNDRTVAILKSPITLLPYQLNLYYRKEEGLSPIREAFLKIAIKQF